MKALVLNEAGRSPIIQDIPDPTPNSKEAVVELKAAALNRRDFWIVQGKYPGVRTPAVLGSDGSGVVVSVGEGVDPSWLNKEVIINPGFQWGDRASVQSSEFRILGMPGNGTFAERTVAPIGQIHAKPPHLNWREAAALPLAGLTAYRALFVQGRLQEKENVLITGVGGGVAVIALQFAVAAKARAWVTSSSPQKIQRAVDLGAAGGFDYTQPGWARILVQKQGEPDLIIDGAGGKEYAELIRIAAGGGRIVNYGATQGAPDRLDLHKVFWKQLHLIGSTMGSPRDFMDMLTFVNQHKIRPVIERSFPLEEANQALQQMESSPQFGKYVLDIKSNS